VKHKVGFLHMALDRLRYPVAFVHARGTTYTRLSLNIFGVNFTSEALYQNASGAK